MLLNPLYAKRPCRQGPRTLETERQGLTLRRALCSEGAVLAWECLQEMCSCSQGRQPPVSSKGQAQAAALVGAAMAMLVRALGTTTSEGGVLPSHHQISTPFHTKACASLPRQPNP